MAAVDAVAPDLGAAQVCRTLGLSRATLYRRRRPPTPPASSPPRPRPPRALAEAERQPVRAVLWAPRFVDLARPRWSPPCWMRAAPWPRSGPWTASWPRTGRPASAATSSPTRVLVGQSCWRPSPASCGAGTAPRCWARRPGPTTTCRCSWTASAGRWSAGRSPTPNRPRWPSGCSPQPAANQQLLPGTLTVQADRGSSMTSKPVAFGLADLGVTKTHSRPHVANDNPYSESQFKTLKYRPGFPDRFGSIQDARAFLKQFFGWETAQHRHSGSAMMTPEARSLRPRRSAPPGPRSGTGRRLRRPSRALRAQAARTQTPAHRGVDQPARVDMGGHSVNNPAWRLRNVDRFRAGDDQPNGRKGQLPRHP
jgi:putative transposase